MNLKSCLPLLLVTVATAICATANAAIPTVFAPGMISGPLDDGSPAFAPDGKTVFFMRGTEGKWTLMESRQADGKWSAPRTVPFSGRWHDEDPAMAPNGSFLLFASNRPTTADGKPLDAVANGKVYTGWGLNLWRVERRGHGWSAPVRLPHAINMSNVVFAPSIAGDGSIYFMARARSDKPIQLFRSQYRDGHYLPPAIVPLGGANAQIRDPAIAPDESFMAFSIVRAETKQPPRLAIAFRDHGRWSKPIDLGDDVNDAGYALGSRLSPDQHILYFYSQRVDSKRPIGASSWNNGKDNIWQLDLSSWLSAQNLLRESLYIRSSRPRRHHPLQRDGAAGAQEKLLAVSACAWQSRDATNDCFVQPTKRSVHAN